MTADLFLLVGKPVDFIQHQLVLTVAHDAIVEGSAGDLRNTAENSLSGLPYVIAFLRLLHYLAEELMTFWARCGHFLYATPEGIERKRELARERTSAHLRLLHWVLDGNELNEYYYDCL